MVSIANSNSWHANKLQWGKENERTRELPFVAEIVRGSVSRFATRLLSWKKSEAKNV